MIKSHKESEVAAIERSSGQALAGWVPASGLLVPLFKRRTATPAAALATKPARVSVAATRAAERRTAC